VPAALDEVVGEARKRLRERGDDLKATPTRVAAMTTTSLPAYRAYVEGLDCASRPDEFTSAGEAGGKCVDLFRRALGHDPGFALAHYQLALLLDASGGASAELAAHIDGAVRAVDRLSRRDAALVKAWKAHLDGKDAEALAMYSGVLAEHPDDLHVLYVAGDLLFHKEDWAGAVPFLERTVGLDPEADWALAHLAECYAAQRRPADLRRLVGQMAAQPPTPAVLRVLVRANVWLGEPAEALARARQAVEAGGGMSARLDLASTLTINNRLPESEALARALAAERPGDAYTAALVIGRLVAQGRLAEARAGLQAVAPALSELDPLFPPTARLGHLARDPAYRTLAEDAERLGRLRPKNAGFAVALLALLGDPEAARRLAPLLKPGTPAATEVQAVLAWRDGDATGALATLLALERRTPWQPGLLPPAYLVAEIAAASGDPGEVVAAGERLRRTWAQGYFWSWLRGRAAFLEARARADLGQVDEARAQVEQLLENLRRADADLPLLRDARALRARLGPPGHTRTGSTSTPAP